MLRVSIFGLCLAMILQPSPGCSQARRDKPSRTVVDSGPHPNEPPGFKPVSIRTFSSIQEPGWGTRRVPEFQIVEDPTAPVSPPFVGQAIFPVGYAGGRGPTNTYLTMGSGFDQLYISCWFKLSSNFEGAPSAGINKIFHIWMGQKSTVVFAALGRRNGPLIPQMRLQNMQMRNRAISFNIDPLRGSLITRGDWHHLEIYLRMNHPGVADGVVQWWLDNREVGNYRTAGFRRFGADDRWRVVSWNPTWGAPRDRVRERMFIEMDQIYVSGLPE